MCMVDDNEKDYKYEDFREQEDYLEESNEHRNDNSEEEINAISDRLSTAEAMRILNDAFYTEEYTDYAVLQENLKRFKEGSREATEYIVKAFHRVTTKYARFVHMGHIPYLIEDYKNGKSHTKIDQSISQFVKLYTKKEDRENHPLRSKCFSAVCTKIVTLFSKYDYCEIYNEMVLALLNMASRYKILNKNDEYYKENGTFPMYVKKCFHWEAKRQLDKLVIDPLAHNETIHLVDDFNEMSDSEYEAYPELLIQDEHAAKDLMEATSRADMAMRIKFSDKLKTKEVHSEYDSSFLDFNWTNGITCSDLFSVLTPMEREILVLIYMKKVPVEMIASSYKCSPQSIRNRKNRAIAKLLLNAEEYGIILQ